MALNFHQLHIFYTVAEKGSFSHAAGALHMTQPAVTMQIQSLEDYFGTKLFVRSTKRVELTEAGRTLLPYAKKSIELIKETTLVCQSSRICWRAASSGASLTVGEYILPRLLGPFGLEYPNISVSMKVINTKQILEEVLNHQLTFGLVEAEVKHSDLHTEAVLSDELKLILPKDHPLGDFDLVPVEELMKYPFVLREQGSGTRRVMEEELTRAGYDPSSLKIVMELGSTGAVKSAVEAGLGISILSNRRLNTRLRWGCCR
ncbi:LysR family transcriptional regulator [Paenibacillus validus]